jgi:8-oxo-dGTP pyrophosphatase MutT (NUDIX family)
MNRMEIKNQGFHTIEDLFLYDQKFENDETLDVKVKRAAGVFFYDPSFPGMTLGIKSEKNDNLYSLPCGKVDQNESIEEAAIRECLEETDISLDIDDLEIRYISTSTGSANDLYLVTVYLISYDLKSIDLKYNSEGELGLISFKDLIDPSQSKYVAYNAQALNYFRKFMKM